MAKEFRIFTQVWDPEAKDHHYAAVKVSGTDLGYGLFAWKETGRTLHPEARWYISDIKTGTGIPKLNPGEHEGKPNIRFATLADCKAWVKNIPEEYKTKIDAARASAKYQELITTFENLPKE